MKKLILSTCLLSGYAAVAQQDLAYKIPQQAGAVVTVRGNKFLELLSASEFNQSEMGKKMLKKMSREMKNGKLSTIEDFGINLTSNLYYYNVQTDSISYNCLLLPLSNAGKFERLFDDDKTIVRVGITGNSFMDSDGMILSWNSEMASLVFGDLKSGYFQDSTVAERYGIKEVSYSDYYYNNDYADTLVSAVASDVDAVEAVETEEATMAVPYTEEVQVVEAPVTDRDDEGEKEPPMVEKYDVAREDPPAFEDIPADAPPPPVVEIAAPVEEYTVAAPVDNDYNRTAYEAAYEEQREIKQKLRKEWTGKYGHATFARTAGSSSILNNKEFLLAQDKNASATLFLDDIGNLYSGLFSYFAYRNFGRSLEGFKGMNAQLYMEKENMRITSEMIVDDKKAASYKKIYSHKLNKKFAKYVNSDKVIGFISYSFDTEAYLKELPEMLNHAYGGYMGRKYQEETDIASELLSIMLDEKAIAEVVKGDALFLVTDIAQKEYTYKAYEYNEDEYERKEVERTKKETLPEFLFMMSSDDSHIIQRLLNYGIKKEAITLKNGIYTLDRDITKSPMSAHLLIKDGIIFCGTSYKDLQDISLDRFQGNISKEQKQLLKSNMTAFFDPKKLAGKIPVEEFHSERRLSMFNTWLNGTGKFYGKTTGIKGNRISGEMIAEVPDGKENSLKYFFSLIEGASKLD